MSVTVRLSKRLSDVLGEDAATELTEYLNAMDLAYRTQLQSLNEHNFTRLDATLGQRLAEFRHEMAEFKVEVRAELAALRQEIAAVRTEVHQEIRGVLRWIFGLWITTMLTMVGLILTLWRAGG